VARFLVLDWDHNQLHLVVASTGRGGARVERALLWSEAGDPGTGDPDALGKRLREHLKGAGIGAAPVLACVGRDRVILKDIRYPAVPPSEEPAVVRFQASKEMTESPDEVLIDYAPFEEPGPAGERRAFAVIMRRTAVARYQALCRAAGLKLAAVTPRPFGIAACLDRAAAGTQAPDSPEAVSAVLTVAGGWAEFCIVRAGKLLFARSLAVSNNLAAEVRRNLAVYAGHTQTSLSRDVVRALYVAGSGEEAELRERLQGLLAIPVRALDPFAPDGAVDVSPGSRAGFTGAAGLAHLWGQQRKAPINFVRVKEPVAKADPNRARKILAVAGVAALFLLGALWGYQAVAAKRKAVDELTQQKADWEATLRAMAPDAKHYEALKDWNDTAIPWLDELYDLAAHFPYREGMRVTQVAAGTYAAAGRTAKDKDKASVRMMVHGVVYRDDDKRIQDLVDAINGDTHTRATVAAVKSGGPMAPGTKKASEEFTLRIDITKQPAQKYTTLLVPPAIREPGLDADLGDMFFPGNN
jgi:Tfp pilus assembly PilM family ATPase